MRAGAARRQRVTRLVALDTPAQHEPDQPALDALLLTTAQTERVLHLSGPTVRDLIRRGEIRVIRFGRAVRIPRVELERFIERRLQLAEKCDAGAKEDNTPASRKEAGSCAIYSSAPTLR